MVKGAAMRDSNEGGGLRNKVEGGRKERMLFASSVGVTTAKLEGIALRGRAIRNSFQ